MQNSEYYYYLCRLEEKVYSYGVEIKIATSVADIG